MSLHVLQLVPALQSGGVEEGVVALDNAVVDAGWRSSVMSSGGAMVQSLEGEHITRQIGKKSPVTLARIFPLARWLKRERPDILFPRSRLPAWIAWWAWRLAGKPGHFITATEGLHSVSRYSAIVTRGERIMAVSETVRDYLLTNYPVDPAKIDVVYPCIDTNRFHATDKTRWPPDLLESFPNLPRQRVLLLPGRLSASKGHDFLIQLLAELEHKTPTVFGLIVGDIAGKKEAIDRWLSMARKLGVDERLGFAGRREDMPALMRASDLVLNLSTQPEAFGRTVAEALACGTPAVGFDHGGVGEILARCYPAGRCPPGDVTGLTRVVRPLLQQAPIVNVDPFPFRPELTTQRQLEVFRCL